MIRSAPRSFFSSLFALSLSMGLIACGDSDDCSTNGDCPTGRICRLGLCALDPGFDGTVDSTPDIPLDCLVAGPDDLIMTEIMADPPSGADIDGNGAASTTGDEFVEVVNIAARPVALTNVQLDVGGKRVGLGTLCINPYQARVLFGSAGLPGLTNSGSTVSLLVDGTVVQTHTYGADGGKDSSLTLTAQLDKTSAWVLHKDVAPTAYSPGTCSNGNDFPDCDGVVNPPDAEVIGDSEVIVPTCSTKPVAGDLLINELLADPTGLDANKDNLPGTGDDEFIELVNVSANTVSLDGLIYRDAGTKVFNFPAGLCLAPDQSLLFFGKYEGTGDFGGAIVLSGNNISLNNDADTVTILDANATVMAQVNYASNIANDDQSIVRVTDLGADTTFVKHTAAPNANGARMSPGFCQNGNAFPDCSSPVEPAPTDTSETDTSETVDPGDTMIEVSDATETIDDVGPTCGPAPVAGDLVINEVMARPGTVDWNDDAIFATRRVQDEYVEVVSVATGPILMQGLKLADFEQDRYTFGSICMEPGEAIVVFGVGAKHYRASGVVQIDIATHSLALNDSVPSGAPAGPGVADQVILRYNPDNVLTALSIAASMSEGVSWARVPDLTGGMVAHPALPSGRRGSPGLCVDGEALPLCLPD